MDFGEWYRVIRDDGTVAVSDRKEKFRIVKSDITSSAMQNLNYLKSIATHTMAKEEEESFLKKWIRYPLYIRRAY